YMQAYQQLASRRFPQANIAPTEEEIYQYYRQYPEFFGIPGMVRVSQIQFRWPENASEQDKAAVRTKAEDALKRLQANAAFADVATELTENPRGKVAGGDLGFLQLDKDPWLQKAVANLKIGQFSGVLESPVGYEIVLLQEQREAMIAPYANVRDNALGRIRQEKHAKAREEYAWTLAKDFGVKVELPELKSAIPENLP
ncbi:MAG TPA: peptidylprolyl isomerase, partial [Gammaproteobacteria bacterium]|nr:peptidylprolyl isomerase [Gammaproteobacteria bacterium]